MIEHRNETPEQLLKKHFGYSSFREGQSPVIEGILNGRDALAVMPTGAGKSICYQIPALLMDGITIVISPLISLMKDQVSSLNQAGIHAAFLNSSLTANQNRLALNYAAEGRYKLIYVAPERLLTREFLDFAMQAQISMVTVDEAHCISQWGQDFRPSYLRITEFITMLSGRPVVSAFTATATKEVKDDISCILKLNDPVSAVTGFDRSNLYFGVQSPKDKFHVIFNYIQRSPDKSGIIYCATRKNVEEVAERLSQEGVLVTRYHAGLSEAERKQNQEDFIYDVKPIMVATNAFGMGIDKSNVRYVLHYNMPKNMESYYQEAGRAGRDGEEAECILLYSGQDVITNQFFIENNRENDEISDEDLEQIRERDRERLKKMTYYCFTKHCLREYIINYFGEYTANYCGHCSNCLTQFQTVDILEISRLILRCVRECGQRFGINLILDTLRGSTNEKVRLRRMDENSCYGKAKEESVHRLRQMVNELLVEGYLRQSEDTYPVLKLSEKSAELFEEGAVMQMKLVVDENKEEGRNKTKQRGKSGKGANAAGINSLSYSEQNLFEHLKQFRLSIAREEGIPPYIVFSDKTLVQMCALKPKTKDEMLQVSGVGEVKYSRYGSRFQNEIAAFAAKM